MAAKGTDWGGESRLGPALADINITPFVDVVLVLLIIFLITAPMLLGGMVRRNPRAAVFLKADEAVAYGVVMKVMDVIKKAGIDRVGMVTEPVAPGGS